LQLESKCSPSTPIVSRYRRADRTAYYAANTATVSTDLTTHIQSNITIISTDLQSNITIIPTHIAPLTGTESVLPALDPSGQGPLLVTVFCWADKRQIFIKEHNHRCRCSYFNVHICVTRYNLCPEEEGIA
jgi:hypothetical protein